MVLYAYIDDIVIGTQGCIDKHYKLGLKVHQLIVDNQMWVDIDKCIVAAKEVYFAGCLVSTTGM
jgi:hypothetical protein